MHYLYTSSLVIIFRLGRNDPLLVDLQSTLADTPMDLPSLRVYRLLILSDRISSNDLVQYQLLNVIAHLMTEVKHFPSIRPGNSLPGGSLPLIMLKHRLSLQSPIIKGLLSDTIQSMAQHDLIEEYFGESLLTVLTGKYIASQDPDIRDLIIHITYSTDINDLIRMRVQFPHFTKEVFPDVYAMLQCQGNLTGYSHFNMTLSDNLYFTLFC